MTETELAQALCQPIPPFAEEAVGQAMADPHLSARVTRHILTEALEAIRGGDPESLNFGPIYALFLAGFHRDQGIFDLMEDFGSLTDDQQEDLLGDTVDSDLPQVLWAMSKGEVSRLYALLDSPRVTARFQDQVLNAMALGVGQGVLDREETLRSLGQRLDALLSTFPASDDLAGRAEPSDAVTWLAVTIMDLGVGDNMDVLSRALDAGLISRDWADRDSLEEGASKTPREVLRGIRESYGRVAPIDPMSLRKWQVFRAGPRKDRGSQAEDAALNASINRGLRLLPFSQYATRTGGSPLTAAQAKAREKTKAQRNARKHSRKKAKKKKR